MKWRLENAQAGSDRRREQRRTRRERVREWRVDKGKHIAILKGKERRSGFSLPLSYGTVHFTPKLDIFLAH